MDLWIRSQDNELLTKIDNVFVKSNYNNYRVYANYLSMTKTIVLGTYKTKERAKQVLDEIQLVLYTPKFPNNTYNFKTYDSSGNLIYYPEEPKQEIVQLNTFVYQMPEE